MTPEGKVKAAIIRWCDEHGYYYFMPVQTGRGRKAVDFFICAGKEFLAVEAKASRKEKPTALQLHTLRQVLAAGGMARVAYFDDDENLVWTRVLR